MTAEPEEPRSRLERTLDELHRWRYFLLGLAVIAMAGAFAAVHYLGVSIPTEMIAVSIASFVIAAALATIVGFPVALRHARPPEQEAIVELDPRGSDRRLRVTFLEPGEADEVDVRWGELEPLPGTDVPARLALRYDREEMRAWGTHRSTLAPDELDRRLHQFDEYFGKQEEEAARTQVLEHRIRTIARRAAQGIVRVQDREYDQATIPGGDSIADVLEEVLPRREEPDRSDDLEDSDDGLDRDDQEPSEDVVPEVEPAGALEPAPAVAETDGGQERD